MKINKLLILSLLLISGQLFSNQLNLVHKDTWGDKTYRMMLSEGTDLYVATDGILILDATDPNNLSKKAKIAINTTDVVKKFKKVGNIIYILTGKEFFIVDIQDIQNPQTLTSIKYPGLNFWADFVIKNSRLFIAGEDNPQLFVYDISIPATPVLERNVSVGNISTNSIQMALTSNDLVLGIAGEIKVLSLLNATFLNELFTETQNFTSDITEPQVIGDVVYFSNNDSILTYDFSDLMNVVKTSVVASTGAITDLKLDTNNNLQVIDTAGFLSFYDVSVPTSPTFSAKSVTQFTGVSFIENSGTITYLSGVFDGIEVVSNFNQVSTYNEAGIHYDLSSQGNTVSSANGEIRLFDVNAGVLTPMYKSSFSGIVGATLDGNYLYSSNQFIYDVSDLTNVSQVSAFSHDTNGSAIYQILIENGELHSRSLTRVTNFTFLSPISLVQKNAIDTSVVTSGASSQSTSLSIKDKNYYLGTTKGMFHFFEDGAQNLLVKGNMTITSPITASEIAGNYLFATTSSILYVWNITDPNNPSLVNSTVTPGLNIGALKIYKNWLFVGSDRDGLPIYDISIPNSPSLVDTVHADLVTIMHDMIIQGNNLMFATNGQIISLQINEAPSILTTDLQTDEDTLLAQSLNVENLENDVLSYQITTPSTNGTVSINNNGQVSYQPNPDYHGADSFVVNVVDALGGNDEKTVNINVISVNDEPVVQSNTFETPEDVLLQGSLSATDVDGDSLTYAIVTQPTRGVVVLNADGTFDFTPNNNVNGSDSFDFTVTDGIGQLVSGSASLTILAVNDAPELVVEDLMVDEDSSQTGSAIASDVEGDSLTFSVSSSASNGTASIDNNGEYSYQPNGDFNGNDSFEISVNDGAVSTTATVNVVINAVNDAPVASASSVSGQTGASISGSVDASDVDGDTLTYSVVTNVSNGTLTFNTDGSFSYQSNSGFVGSDSFTYQVSDSSGATSQALVTITVTAIPTPPASGGGGSTEYFFLLLLLFVGISKYRS